MRRLNENGAVAALVAIMLVLIIVCVALVVDLGHIHNAKVQLQRAVDAAALSGAVQIPDADLASAAAVATAAENEVDGITGLGADDLPAWATDSQFEVVLGTWNKEIVAGETAADRFTAGVEPPNAVKVTATREVEHIFFFFTEGTEVTADAIAISKFEEETIPIALVSCIPTGGGSLNIASPGLSICDVVSYEFHSDKDDTAAWTSLTFNPASKPLIQQFLTEEGRALFNEVIYGTTTPSHDGIENTSVETGTRQLVPGVPDVAEYDSLLRGCIGNDGTTISCGLGEDISLDPESITDIRKLDPSKVPAAAQSDPLAYDPLPRWYHFSDPSPTYDYLNDAFTRIWTQDGHLVPPLATQSHLQELYETSDGIANSPYGTTGAPDFRFKKFINLQGGTYKPNFNEVLRYAGYPPVWVNNGTIPPALDEFIDRIASEGDTTFKSSLSSENEPFDNSSSGGRGNTVKLTIPVIFAGSCDEWKALSTGPLKSDIKLYYVGTANFLVTRAWKNPNCYEHGTDPLEYVGHAECGASDFDPGLAAGNTFECTGGPGSNPSAGLEGLIRPPTRGEESIAGLRRIYLVE